MASKSLSLSLNWYFGDINSCLWLVNVAHAHLMRCSNSTCTLFFFARVNVQEENSHRSISRATTRRQHSPVTARRTDQRDQASPLRFPATCPTSRRPENQQTNGRMTLPASSSTCAAKPDWVDLRKNRRDLARATCRQHVDKSGCLCAPSAPCLQAHHHQMTSALPGGARSTSPLCRHGL